MKPELLYLFILCIAICPYSGNSPGRAYLVLFRFHRVPAVVTRSTCGLTISSPLLSTSLPAPIRPELRQP